MTNYVPNQKYNPEFQENVTAKTLLAPGIPMARFLGGVATASTIDHITVNQTEEDLMKLAKQLHMQAAALFAVSRSKSFDFHRIRPAEGYYRIPKTDPPKIYEKTSVVYLRNKGQAIVYEVMDEAGNIDLVKSFDLALWFTTNKIAGIFPQKTILSYDNFNPNGLLHAQVTLIMPELSGGWGVKYSGGENQVETKYNGFSQSNGELIEVLEEEREESVLYDIVGKN